MPPVTEETRVVRLLRGAVAIRRVREEEGWSHREFGRRVGASHVTVLSWEKGESIPDEKRQLEIEGVCAVVDPTTGRPVVNPETGRVVSRCPREYWKPLAASEVASPAISAPEIP